MLILFWITPVLVFFLAKARLDVWQHWAISVASSIPCALSLIVVPAGRLQNLVFLFFGTLAVVSILSAQSYRTERARQLSDQIAGAAGLRGRRPEIVTLIYVAFLVLVFASDVRMLPEQL